MRLSMMEQVMNGLKDPSVRAVIEKVAPSLAPLFQHCASEDEEEKTAAVEADCARAGLPASSKPGAKSAPLIDPPRRETMRFPSLPASTANGKPAAAKEVAKPEVEPTVPTVPARENQEVVETKPTDKSIIQDEGPGEINSSTHRAAHARLTRRMQTLDVSKFPQMARLWGGSRKELVAT